MWYHIIDFFSFVAIVNVPELNKTNNVYCSAKLSKDHPSLRVNYILVWFIFTTGQTDVFWSTSTVFQGSTSSMCLFMVQITKLRHTVWNKQGVQVLSSARFGWSCQSLGRVLVILSSSRSWTDVTNRCPERKRYHSDFKAAATMTQVCMKLTDVN